MHSSDSRVETRQLSKRCEDNKPMTINNLFSKNPELNIHFFQRENPRESPVELVYKSNEINLITSPENACDPKSVIFLDWISGKRFARIRRRGLISDSLLCGILCRACFDLCQSGFVEFSKCVVFGFRTGAIGSRPGNAGARMFARRACNNTLKTFLHVTSVTFRIKTLVTSKTHHETSKISQKPL